ncbi:MAG TPA: VOC family protein [Thermoleophilia bacterium]|nr:VOC family protein [Thermoleophilia bacterium]
MSRTTTRLSTAQASTTLPAEDLKRARAFYEEKLGLETELRDDMPEGLFVHAGKGSLIVLYQRGRATAENTALTFEVDDLEATVTDLRSHGVKLEEYDFPGLKTVGGIATREVDRAAWFKDSEGNILCAHETLAA